MSGLLVDLADGLGRITSALRAALPASVTVERSGGAFDGGEIRRQVTQAPAVVLACLGVSDYQRRGDGGWSVTAQLAVYVLTRDAPPGPPRDLLALSLTTTVLRAVARANWDGPDGFGVVEADSLEASNLYSGDLDAIAVALWAVTWRQEFRLAFTSPAIIT
ncbi:MAG: hypothetical protein RLZZ524_1390 [Pseudomonadota bacterium]|jgi:hypothetical protein